MRTAVAATVGILGVAAITSLGWAVASGPLRNPHHALRDFYQARDRAEDQLMDPLILNGRRVLPLVLADLPNKDMRLRRYAIGYLGNGGYRDALPVLEQVLADESEKAYFRADALAAIHDISADRARMLAPAHLSGEALLGEVAQSIVAGQALPYSRRSYWQALTGRHD